VEKDIIEEGAEALENIVRESERKITNVDVFTDKKKK